MAGLGTIPAVCLQPGWRVEIEGQEALVQSNKRVENGPRWCVTTDIGAFELSAALQVRVLSVTGSN